MKIQTLLFIAILLLVATVPAQAVNDEKLSVSVSEHSITASGLSPGSTAVFFGVALVPVPHAYMNRVQRWAVTVDDIGRKGTVTLDLEQKVPPGSVWAVVDLRNAHYGMVSGPGFGIRQMPLANPLRKGQSQTADRFSFNHRNLDLLYVHPGAGAWTWSASGGSVTEAASPNNATVVSLADGKPVGQAGSKPANFLPGGLLVAIDYNGLEIAVVPVDQQLIGGVR